MRLLEEQVAWACMGLVRLVVNSDMELMKVKRLAECN